MDRRLATILSTVGAGRAAYLLEAVYFPVDSLVTGDLVGVFNIEPAREYLALGWEVCGVVPRTSGVALKNTTGMLSNAWGAGMGGNVIGVHLLLRYKVDAQGLETARDTVREHIERTTPL